MNKTLGLIGISLQACLLPGCMNSMPIANVADLPPGLEGVWKSTGYGYLIDASGEKLAAYHITPDVCLPDQETAAVFSMMATHKNLAYDSEREAFYFSFPLEDYAMEMRAIEQVPTRCATAPDNSPIGNFEAFASFMETHYAFFDLYGVNWSQSVAAARNRIAPETTDAELFAIMSEMLSPMTDGHLVLTGKVDGKRKQFEPGESAIGKALARLAAERGESKNKLENKFMKTYWMDEVKKDILGSNGKMVANDFIQYGIVSDDIGYIAIATTGGYAGKGPFHEEEDLAALRKALDGAMTVFEENNAKAVFVDLSVNFGGYSFTVREIASRFAQEKTHIYSKRAGDDPGSKPFDIYIEPSDAPGFSGPVYLLTSNVTVSAGEELTMALRAMPQITHIGEPTRGALSDVLNKTLPNGWTLELSNEVFTDHNGELWESRGITPHLPMKVFDRANPFEGHAEAVRKVLQLMSGQQKQER